MPQIAYARLSAPRLIGALLTFALLLPVADAQQDPTAPATLRITQINLKPGYNAVWTQMQKELLLPFYERSGFPFVGVYRVRFDDYSEFAVVAPVESLDIAGKTTEEGLKRFQETNRQALEGSRTYIQRKLTDLSFGEAVEQPYPHLSVSHITIAPGKRAAFLKSLRETAIPRWKKMGIPALMTWEILYGYNSGKFVVAVPLENYSELAEGLPFYRGMSEADLAALQAANQGVILDIKRVTADFMPELSYMPQQ